MYYLGIDIGGTFVKLGIVSEEGQIIAKSSKKTNFSCGYAITIKDIAYAALDLLEEMGLEASDLIGVGIGVPGTVHNGIVTFANNLKWNNVPIAEEFRRYLNTEIAVDNDANCAVWGEYVAGAGKDYENIVMITIGTGLGTGFISDGRMIRGYKSAGAEGGHIVMNTKGHDCNCGRKGCYEQYAATTSMINMVQESIKNNPSGVMAQLKERAGEVNGFTLFDAVRQGDKEARTILDRYISDIAVGLINLANIFRPEIILIGGGVSNEEDLLIRPLEDIVNKYAYGGDLNPRITVEKAMLGNDAGTVGAACLLIKK